jgi:hypothetical protein
MMMMMMMTRIYRGARQAEEQTIIKLIISTVNPTIRRKLKAFAVSNVEEEFKILPLCVPLEIIHEVKSKGNKSSRSVVVCRYFLTFYY